jgi:transposase InsO family protein
MNQGEASRTMQVWFTAGELADRAVEGAMPGLPATQRGIQKLAEREGWATRCAQARPRQGREGGGGLEYHLDLLPLPTRLAYAASFVSALKPPRPSIPADEGLTGSARRQRDARLVLVGLADRLRSESALSVIASDTYLSSLYNGGHIVVAPWVRQTVKAISAPTLARWRKTARTNELRLGVEAARNRAGTGVLDLADGGAVKTLILAVLAKQPLTKAETVLDMVAARYPQGLPVRKGKTVPVPPIRAFQRALKSWKTQYRNELAKLADPDGYRSKYEFVAIGTQRADRLNEVWQIDASPLDAITTEGRRPTIYAAIDVFSRRCIILVTETPRAAAVSVLIRKCLLAWGVPERIKTDNGSDFTAHAIGRLLSGLGIEIELSPPYTPRAKAIVERVIGTFQRDFAARLPGFVGHSVAQRKVIENRKAFSRRLGEDDAHLFDADMADADIQAYADDWAGTNYAHTAHDGLGGMTPFAKAASFAGPIRRIEELRGLDLLLAPVVGSDGQRKVTKTGIRVNGEHYLIGTVMPGTDVFCRHDPADLGRLYVYALDQETFLGHAICPLLSGLDPVVVAGQVKAQQKAFLDGNLKPIRAAMRKIGPRDIADAQRAAGQRRAGNLVAFERPSVPHDTAALRAASLAGASHEARPQSVEQAKRHAELLAKPAAAPLPRNVRQLRTTETREQRFARALSIEGRIAAAEPVAPEEARWLGGYQADPEFKAMKRMRERAEAAGQ